MSLLSRIAISNGNQERKDEATRLLNRDDKNRHDECNDLWQAEIDEKTAEVNVDFAEYGDLLVEWGE